MHVQRLSSFSDGDRGGNPAGVLIADVLPSDEQMRSMAAEVGYSETAFAAPEGDGWRVRYFSPESEVPFCGHATIALGAALAERSGAGVYALTLNDADITVEGSVADGVYSAALQSPPTRSTLADSEEVSAVLAMFGYSADDLDPRLPPARINAGAEHPVIGLAARDRLRDMTYDLDQGRALMRDSGLVTIMFVVAASDRGFHSRNAFASGGVYEDPATGAASAAFAGYLRDLGWAHGGAIEIVQGEDMGSRSLISATFSDEPGASVRVAGTVRRIPSPEH
ncbi:MAG: PhzF family phenazine biosynthesis protein [Pseudomonadota bacterium]